MRGFRGGAGASRPFFLKTQIPLRKRALWFRYTGWEIFVFPLKRLEFGDTIKTRVQGKDYPSIFDKANQLYNGERCDCMNGKYPSRQTLFENKMAVISSVIAAATVIVAAIGLIPQFRDTFFRAEEPVQLTANMSGRKVQRVVEDVAGEYFDDTLVEIFEPADDGKVIRVAIYAFNDDRVDLEKIVAMAEEVYAIASGEDSGVCALRFTLITQSITQSIPGWDKPVYVPVIIFHVDKTTTSEDEPIWVSFLMQTTYFSRQDLMKYEYNKSDIFSKIDLSNFENTHYWEDSEKHAYLNSK